MVKASVLSEKFNTLIDTVDGEMQERTDLAYTAVLAILSRKHHFQVGPPGIAKSLLVERIIKYISDWPEGGYYHKLLTKYTTEDEIFGSADMTELLENSIYRRKTDRRLPVASIAVLDEIFKGNSSVLNALLMAMNERQFDDEAGLVNIPLITMFGMSNELPEGEELNAMWDRLHIRHEVGVLQDGESFEAMLESTFDPDPDPIVSMADITKAHIEIDKISIPKSVVQSLRELRSSLKRAGIEPTDRRWRQSLDVIRANTWLHGDKTAKVPHTRVLMHMMWDRPEDIKKVQGLVLDLADPLEKEAQNFFDTLVTLENEFNENIDQSDNPQTNSQIAVEIFGKLEKLKERILPLKASLEEAGRSLRVIKTYDVKYKKFNKRVMVEGFGVGEEELPG